MTITVKKRNRKTQKFSKLKLERGIKRAATRTSVTTKDAASVAKKIRIKVEKTARRKKDKTIRSTEISTILLKELSRTKANREIAKAFRAHKR